MKPILINRTLQPPDRIVSDDAVSSVIEHILGWVKKNYSAEDLFDLHDHDREVALKFYRWRKNYIGDNMFKLPTEEEIWDIYCTENKH